MTSGHIRFLEGSKPVYKVTKGTAGKLLETVHYSIR